MSSRPARALLLAGAASLLIAIPAFSQQAPESILPPGFGDPEPAPPPPPPPPPQPPAAPPPGFGPAQPPAAAPPSPPPPATRDAAQEDLTLLPPRPRRVFDVPEGARRPTDTVGVLAAGRWGLGLDAFGNANGVFLSSLMRRLDAPLPSRWTSILLRRALLSRVTAPPGVDPVDWVAERAALLLRMGEADAARMLVQSVDSQDYTPRMIAVALETALATADPGGICPLVERGRQDSDDPIWPMSEAMCAALEGEAARASLLIDQARSRGRASGIDLSLAEKVVGAGTDTRRAVSIQWEGVNELSPWRFGLASATGMEIPERLIGGAGPRVQGWLARAAMVPLEHRLSAAHVAASLGIFSSRSLVDVYSLVLDQTDPADVEGTIAARLRTAWSHGDPAARLRAMRGIWEGGEGEHERHARLILTAGAAARIQPSGDHVGDAGNLIASLLSAGMDSQAARWADVVGQGGADERAWALLAVGAPRPVVETSQGRIDTFRREDASRGHQRTRLLVAALAGLGRLDNADRVASAFDVPVGRENRWVEMLDQAARNGQAGTVALLAGVGMQTASWQGVPPHHLFRIVRALRSVGLEHEARMIAAEALIRL